MRDRHGSPFEHNSMTFYVQAPIFVFREFMRHRIASYNEESGRYRELRPVFYVPAPERNLVQQGKPGAYEFVPGTPEQTAIVDAEVRKVCDGGVRLLPADARRGHRPRSRPHRAATHDLLVDVRDRERALAHELPLAAHEARGLAPSRRSRSGRSRWRRSRWSSTSSGSCRSRTRPSTRTGGFRPSSHYDSRRAPRTPPSARAGVAIAGNVGRNAAHCRRSVGVLSRESCIRDSVPTPPCATVKRSIHRSWVRGPRVMPHR